MLPKATNAALTTRWMVARISKVKRREPKPVLVPHFQVVDPFQLAGGSGDPVAAFEELLGHVAAKAAGDEPSAL
jgi:hypothetical protein